PQSFGWLLLLVAACDSSGCDSPTQSPTDAAAPSATGASSVPADPRERFLAQSVGNLLTTQHLLQRPLDDAVSREAFEAFLERLDGGKLFLLEPQVAELRKFADDMDDQLKRGDLVLARQATVLLAERRRVVGELIADLLSKP